MEACRLSVSRKSRVKLARLLCRICRSRASSALASGPVNWGRYRDTSAEELAALIEAKRAQQPAAGRGRRAGGAQPARSAEAKRGGGTKRCRASHAQGTQAAQPEGHGMRLLPMLATAASHLMHGSRLRSSGTVCVPWRRSRRAGGRCGDVDGGETIRHATRNWRSWAACPAARCWMANWWCCVRVGQTSRP